MREFVYASITVQQLGDKFEVCISDVGDDRCELFDHYHDARAWAGGRYAQGYVVSIKDKVADAVNREQMAEMRAAINEDFVWSGVGRA